MISEKCIENDVKGSGRGRIKSAVPVLAKVTDESHE
jgi:hypothetical protein